MRFYRNRESCGRNLKRACVPYARLYIAPISGRLLALNLNGSVRTDGIDTIDFFFLCGPAAMHICMYVYGANNSKVLSACMSWNAIVRCMKKNDLALSILRIYC